MGFFQKNKVTKPNCIKCSLNGCKSQNIGYSGQGGKKILIIGEAPTTIDDTKGTLRFHRLVSKELLALGINANKDCWYTTAVQCTTYNESLKKSGEPTDLQVQNCRNAVTSLIKELKPTKILLMGNPALKMFYGDRNTQCTSAYKMAGMKLWDSTYNAWVFPLWDAEFIQKKKFDKLLYSEFKRCFTYAVDYSSKPLKKNWNPIHKLTNFKDAVIALKHCLRNELCIAIDYETTGLDMFKKGHKTVSFAWATSKGAWAVPVQHPHWKKKEQEEIFSLIQKILRKRKIRKIVQGINFEYPWTKRQMKTKPSNFFWDTQLATHVLDARTGITGLKFQCFARWGIEEYDKLSKKYIKQVNGNAFNDMLKMPVEALLEYNAKDTLYTYELYLEQLGEFEGRELEAYNFMHEGAIAMCEMSYNGICINEEFYIQQKKELEAERDKLIEQINNSKEAKKYAVLMKRTFDYNSPKHLQVMLFDVLKLKSIKETKTGHSVDEEVLTKIGIPLTKDIITVRKLNKMITTYVDGFLKRAEMGKLHPTFSLHRARSFRSSSSNPNWQNVPKRDPKAKRITRSGIVPRPGNVLGELDFSGAEISVSCYMHKDPTFIKYQTSGGGDMHRDASAEILKIKGDEVPKQIRQCTKGVWTFSQFYGSYYVSCAKQGWSDYPLCVDGDNNPVQVRGMPVGEWMKDTFKNQKGFENHLKKFQDKFWNDWFKVYTKWKDQICKEYIRKGYIETPFGFRCKGLMDNKQATNYIIQGTSFHLLLHTIIEFWKECKRRGMKTLIVGQIHDSLIIDAPVEELPAVKEIIADIIPNLHKTFKWMDFPMGYDLELSAPYEDGGSFAKMTAV